MIMYQWSNDIKQIIGKVLHANNPISCFKQYANYPPVKDITFLLFDGNSETIFQNIAHDYCSSKYSIVNLADYKKTMQFSLNQC